MSSSPTPAPSPAGKRDILERDPVEDTSDEEAPAPAREAQASRLRLVDGRLRLEVLRDGNQGTIASVVRPVVDAGLGDNVARGLNRLHRAACDGMRAFHLAVQSSTRLGRHEHRQLRNPRPVLARLRRAVSQAQRLSARTSAHCNAPVALAPRTVLNGNPSTLTQDAEMTVRVNEACALAARATAIVKAHAHALIAPHDALLTSLIAELIEAHGPNSTQQWSREIARMVQLRMHLRNVFSTPAVRAAGMVRDVPGLALREFAAAEVCGVSGHAAAAADDAAAVDVERTNADDDIESDDDAY